MSSGVQAVECCARWPRIRLVRPVADSRRNPWGGNGTVNLPGGSSRSRSRGVLVIVPPPAPADVVRLPPRATNRPPISTALPAGWRVLPTSSYPTPVDPPARPGTHHDASSTSPSSVRRCHDATPHSPLLRRVCSSCIPPPTAGPLARPTTYTRLLCPRTCVESHRHLLQPPTSCSARAKVQAILSLRTKVARDRWPA